MKLYVAGGWKYREEIAQYAKRLEDHGHYVVSTWAGREQGIRTPQAFEQHALADIDEVSNADVLVAVMTDPEYAYRGTFSEIGCALGLNKDIIIVCPNTGKQISDTKWEFDYHCQTNVFYWHPAIFHTKNLVETLEQLENIKQTRDAEKQKYEDVKNMLGSY
jgi:nucleoside 2-deoxyribosyltransferase